MAYESESAAWKRVVNIVRHIRRMHGYREGGDLWVGPELHRLEDLANQMLMQLRAGVHENRPRRTKRLMRKKRHYEFFRAGSIAGIDKPSEGAVRAKQLADAIEWAFKQGVEYRYYYGRDADPEATSEWDGLIVAVHPKGMEGQAYGYLGNDYSQRHVEAEAALDLKLAMRK